MTKLRDIVPPEALSTAIGEGLVRSRKSTDGLVILNYTEKAVYTRGAWDNPAVRACRGIIIDPERDNEVIARPWAKFFNHGQAEAGELRLDAPVEVTDKMDGSLGIVYLDKAGLPSVATRGSFTSDQALHATSVLRERYPSFRPRPWLTPLVEIIYPENRIVCDYGITDDLILLGAVDIDTGQYVSPRGIVPGWPGQAARIFPYRTLRYALSAPPRPGAEGLCVRYLDEDRIVKVKQADYVELHRIVTGLSERSVWEAMTEGRTLAHLLDGLPDELHEWTREVWDRLYISVLSIYEAAFHEHKAVVFEIEDKGYRLDSVVPQAARDYRRAFADRAKRHDHLTPYLFNLLDGRDPRPAILRSLRPAGDGPRPVTRTEDVA